jgi:hypothetical protein
LVYSEVYQCKRCQEWLKLPFSRQWNWMCRNAVCPRCGNPEVKKLPKRDGIDRMYNNPLSRLQQLFGAPIYHCHWCRLQFYDLRPRVPKIKVTQAGPA